MRWFCRHAWTVQAKAYAPPGDHGLRSIKGPDAPVFLERARLGFTTALLACSKCGAVEKHEMLGAPTEANDPKA